MQDNLKTVITLIIAIPSLASTYFMYQDREQQKKEKEAKADTILLFIQHQNQQNEKLHAFFAALDSNAELSAIADSTGK